jgi:carboxymethylenebutenolidase
MGERIEIPGAEGPVRAYTAEPAPPRPATFGLGPSPAEPVPQTALFGVVVLHEWWGLFSAQSNVASICDRLAAEGMLAIAPDLYGGRSAETEEQAERLMRDLDDRDPLPVISAAVAEARRRGARKVATLGFCMGGALSLRAAGELRGLDAAVSFYGLGDTAGPLRVPAQGHFALRDGYIDPARPKGLQGVELHFYDAGHAFMNERRPEAYDAASAALAWKRALAFLRSR